MIVVKRGDAPDARLQMASRGAVAGANFQEMIAKRRAAEDQGSSLRLVRWRQRDEEQKKCSAAFMGRNLV